MLCHLLALLSFLSLPVYIPLYGCCNRREKQARVQYGEAHYKLLLESSWHVVLALLALELSSDLSVASSCLDLQCIASLHLVVCLFHWILVTSVGGVKEALNFVDFSEPV